MKPLKSLEKLSKRLRCHLSPKFRNSAAELRRKSTEIPANKKTCLFDFHKSEIDSDMARYLFPLVHEMRLNGYHIAFTNRFLFLATANHKKFKKLAFANSFTIVPAKGSEATFDIVYSDSVTSAYRGISKNIYVDYKERMGTNDPANIEVPFFVHPQIQKEHSELPIIELEQQRKLRILFAGNAENPQYDRECLELNYGLISRVKALQIAKQHLTKDQVRRPTQFSDIYPTDKQLNNTLTISTTQSCSIPSDQWLETLAQADFFLALPGVHMPMCHNLIESLYVGAIPILQYSQYLNPNLQHGINCLTFSDQLSLEKVLDQALNMATEDILRLRKNVLIYREEHLAPSLFGSRIVNSSHKNLTLLMNSYKVRR